MTKCEICGQETECLDNYFGKLCCANCVNREENGENGDD